MREGEREGGKESESLVRRGRKPVVSLFPHLALPLSSLSLLSSANFIILATLLGNEIVGSGDGYGKGGSGVTEL